MKNFFKSIDETRRENLTQVLIILLSTFILITFSEIIYQSKIRYLLRSSLTFSTGDSVVYGLIYLAIPILYTIRYKMIPKVVTLLLVQAFLIFIITYFLREKILKSYFAFFYLIPLLILIILTKIAPVRVLGIKMENLFLSITYGLVASLLILGHLYFTINLTRSFYFNISSLDYVIYWFFYNFGLNAIGEELFYRGYIFGELMRQGFSFWLSSIISTVIFLGKYASLPSLQSNPALLFGTLFYLSIFGITSCFIFFKTKNLFSSIVFNFIFNFFCNLISVK